MQIKAKADVQWPRLITFDNIIEKTTYRDLQAGKPVNVDPSIAKTFIDSGLAEEVQKVKANKKSEDKGD